MAYTVTWTLTRPNEGTAIPTITSFDSDVKEANDTIWSDNSVTKTYEIDGLVTRVIYTAADKSTFDTAKAASDGVSGETALRSSYKQALIDASISCVVVDSDGTELANF